MAAVHGDQIVGVGPAGVAVPFLDVAEFASMHGGAVFEVSPVAFGCGAGVRAQ